MTTRPILEAAEGNVNVLFPAKDVTIETSEAATLYDDADVLVGVPRFSVVIAPVCPRNDNTP